MQVALVLLFELQTPESAFLGRRLNILTIRHTHNAALYTEINPLQSKTVRARGGILGRALRHIGAWEANRMEGDPARTSWVFMSRHRRQEGDARNSLYEFIHSCKRTLCFAGRSRRPAA